MSENNDEDQNIINFDEIDDSNVEIINDEEDNSGDILDDNTDDEDFSEVLELTEFNDNMLVPTDSNDFIVAEYGKIETVELSKAHKIQSKNFVGKVTKFVLDFNDIELSLTHKKYLKQVANFQMEHLSDLLLLVDVNRKMIENIVARVNATQAEDYVVITSYTTLINQHLKLIKELQTTYKSVPGIMKKMRAEVLSDDELVKSSLPEEIITEDYGDTQFNSSKQLLKQILERRKKRQVIEGEELEENTDKTN